MFFGAELIVAQTVIKIYKKECACQQNMNLVIDF
jgi:hypothetical protein